jgi:hypothetical protein
MNLRSLLTLSLLAASVACQGAGQAGDARPYPLDICIVTSNELGSMGDPYVFVHDGQEIKLCCKPCLAEFEENPAKFLALLKDA